MKQRIAAAPPPRTSIGDALRSRLDLLAVAALALLCALPGITNAFVYDDVALIQDNARVHDAGNWVEILSSAYWPPPFAPQLYRPVASLLAALEYTIGLGSPVVFRAVSYVLYACAAVAVFRLASRLLGPRAALAAGVLFAVHPVHVEAIALGVNQGELIVGLIAAVMTYRYVVARRSGPLSARQWAFQIALYAIAALTKENGFVLPALLVAAELLVVAPEAGQSRPLGSLAAGFGALAATALVVIGARMLVLGGSVAGAIPADALAGVGVYRRVLTLLQIVPTWLRLFAWPAHLQADYSPNEIVASTTFGAREAAGLAILVFAAVVAFLERRRWPAVTFGLAWVAIGLFPVSNVVVPTGVVVAERTLFLPSIGFVIVVAALSQQLARTVCEWWRPIGKALLAAGAAIAVLGAARSMRRELVWNNNQRLAAATAHDAPRSLAVKKAHRDAVAALMADYEQRIAASPEPWTQRNQLAMLLHAMGEDSSAAEQFRASLEQHPAQPGVALAMAELLIASGRYADAANAARHAIASGDTASVWQRVVREADSAASASRRR